MLLVIHLSNGWFSLSRCVWVFLFLLEFFSFLSSIFIIVWIGSEEMHTQNHIPNEWISKATIEIFTERSTHMWENIYHEKTSVFFVINEFSQINSGFNLKATCVRCTCVCVCVCVAQIERKCIRSIEFRPDCGTNYLYVCIMKILCSIPLPISATAATAADLDRGNSLLYRMCMFPSSNSFLLLPSFASIV